jgi:hypothetical protein
VNSELQIMDQLIGTRCQFLIFHDTTPTMSPSADLASLHTHIKYAVRPNRYN